MTENAIDCLEEATNFAIHFDTYNENAQHTSPSIRGIISGGWVMEKDGNRCAQLLHDIEIENHWDIIRKDERFSRISEKLKRYAKKPE